MVNRRIVPVLRIPNCSVKRRVRSRAVHAVERELSSDGEAVEAGALSTAQHVLSALPSARRAGSRDQGTATVPDVWSNVSFDCSGTSELVTGGTSGLGAAIADTYRVGLRGYGGSRRCLPACADRSMLTRARAAACSTSAEVGAWRPSSSPGCPWTAPARSESAGTESGCWRRAPRHRFRGPRSTCRNGHAGARWPAPVTRTRST
jgi:hypothetical protein